jgi:pantoate--beta-alanine ligase
VLSFRNLNLAPDTILNIAELRSTVARWRAAGEKVAFVPTMGALHDGHLSLVLLARAEGARVIVSIFVNPLQFGPTEDFARYPRTLKDDVEKLKIVGADVVFAPAAAEIYPIGFQTSVINKKMSHGLCGKFRPGHFDGVLTVVLKLLNIVSPDLALFGKKDYQQWRLIERMALDLELPLEIRGCDTVREKDGVAMSSRNRYMSAEEREESTLIYKGLSAARAAWQGGERSRGKLLAAFSDSISRCPRMTIQYAEIVDCFSLEPAIGQVADKNLVMIVAVLFGDVRLIDNLEF